MTRPTVLILNGSEDLLSVLAELLQAEGMNAVCARTPDIERGREDFRKLVQEHDPAVIVFDVSVPFGRSWATCQELAEKPEVSGRPFVITTTNREGAEEYTGPDVIELLLKPYDIGRFLSAVKEALNRSAPHRRSRVLGTGDGSSSNLPS
ncbi:response regulator [Pyxidicoccus fallax]|uniref:Response regulator n=1 Tax=Pyxidicoccus fallax TaxID=394095 RepID=A0A848LY63_9BACT|nr:response regulator [Pyxidicoccus fallax]NMO22540.1 response regulator [Pyxidicoccus fallax]NPC85633.1 response regulator [Pyxidicoccus fallax]